MMDPESLVTNTFQLRGSEYIICLSLNDEDSIIVEVEDKGTSDQWRTAFDAPFIEDLTQRTGNYKQFKIFASMLESAITQSSDSVSLDLLTYADLESLRNKKSISKVAHQQRSNTLNSKRYLILTYTVEFDRIHYPLPLPYVGKPNPRQLQDTIRQLKNEIKILKQHGSKEVQHKELEKMKREYDHLLQEKEDLEADFIDFKRQVQNTSQGAAAKEIRVLKGMLKHMEQDLLTERTKHQRKSSKLNQDYRKTFEELEEVRVSERNLRVRLKSLTNELNVYKRGRSANRSNNSNMSRHSSRDSQFCSSLAGNRNSSRDNSVNRNSRSNSLTRNTRLSRETNRLSVGSRDHSLTRLPRTLNSRRERSISTERNSTQPRQRSLSRDSERGRSFMRGTASSRERVVLRDRARSSSRDRSFTSVGSKQSSHSVSLVGGKSPRFDPTAYQRDKERRRQEAEQKLRRHQGGRLQIRPRRPSPAGSLRSHASSVESLSEIDPETDASENRHMNRVLKTNRSPPSSVVSSPDSIRQRSTVPSKTSKILASTPDNHALKTRSRLSGKENRLNKGAAIYDRSEEISEIDERLNRLQQFMKQNLQC